jgi:hypothetical protein
MCKNERKEHEQREKEGVREERGGNANIELNPPFFRPSITPCITSKTYKF